MKKLLLIIYLILSSSLVFAGGGVWVLEIEYRFKQVKRTGFVVDYNWNDTFESYIGKNSLFISEFRNKFRDTDTITIYEKIIDQERLSEIATFSIHPFILVESSNINLRLEEIELLSLIKVWKKSDYAIDVLTEIFLADSSWIKKKISKDYPLGDEIGCRLEVSNFGDSKSYQIFIDEFSALYIRKEELTREELYRYDQLLRKLKEIKVVVVELCGC